MRLFFSALRDFLSSLRSQAAAPVSTPVNGKTTRMPRFSVVAFLLGAFASTACSSSDAGSSGARNDGPPPDEAIGQTTGALGAYLTSEGNPPLPIDQLEIQASAETSE